MLDRVDDAIDEIEQDVIAQPREESLQRIFSLKRDLIAMRRVVTPMRDFFARDADEITHLPGMQPDDTLYFRDLYDSLVRTSDLIDSYRDLLSGATDMYLSTVANRQGEIAKQLTIIATIFLPLDVPDRVLRPELRVSNRAHPARGVVVLRARPRSAGRLDHRILVLLPPQRLAELGLSRTRRGHRRLPTWRSARTHILSALAAGPQGPEAEGRYDPRTVMGTSLISIKDVASAQSEFRHEDWATRSRWARDLALSINGYEVSPRPRGYSCHRPRWVWVEADAAGRKVPWQRFPAARPDRRADADHAPCSQRPRLSGRPAPRLVVWHPGSSDLLSSCAPCRKLPL